MGDGPSAARRSSDGTSRGSDDLLEPQAETGEVFGQAVGAVGGGLRLERDGEELAGGVGSRIRDAADLDDVRKLDEVEVVVTVGVVLAEHCGERLVHSALCLLRGG